MPSSSAAPASTTSRTSTSTSRATSWWSSPACRGSGKSSLAFDTLYAEGQRRYVESLSAYARQFLGRWRSPTSTPSRGSRPAISIEQKSTVAATRAPRSRTVTEIYDYLRLLYARVGGRTARAAAESSGAQTAQQIVDQVLALPEGTRLMLLAPVVRGRKGEYREAARADRARRASCAPASTARCYDARRRAAELDKQEEARHRGRRRPPGRRAEASSASRRLASRRRSQVGERHRRAARPDDGAPSTSACLRAATPAPTAALASRSSSRGCSRFNSPYGACPTCDGLGMRLEHRSASSSCATRSLSLAGGAIAPWRPRHRRCYRMAHDRGLAEALRLRSRPRPGGELPEEVRTALLYGSGGDEITFTLRGRARPRVRLRARSRASCRARAALQGDRVGRRPRASWSEYMTRAAPAPTCGGARLRPEALAVRVGGRNIDATWRADGSRAAPLGRRAAGSPTRERRSPARSLKEIRDRLALPGRRRPRLPHPRPRRRRRCPAARRSASGWRRRSAAGLVGVLYVLDEPSIGLHQRDNARLHRHPRSACATSATRCSWSSTTRRRSAPPTTWSTSGPGAGIHGGEIVAAGHARRRSQASPDSLTGRYLRGERGDPGADDAPQAATAERLIAIAGRAAEQPEGRRRRDPARARSPASPASPAPARARWSTTSCTRPWRADFYRSSRPPGAARRRSTGSSSIDKVIDIDQSPIGRTPRSNPATYTGVFDHIREAVRTTPRRRCAATRPAASASTSRAAAARPARATA